MAHLQKENSPSHLKKNLKTFNIKYFKIDKVTHEEKTIEKMINSKVQKCVN